jgi:hypothetical protein
MNKPDSLERNNHCKCSLEQQMRIIEKIKIKTFKLMNIIHKARLIEVQLLQIRLIKIMKK